jgi:hypothetical protein
MFYKIDEYFVLEENSMHHTKTDAMRTASNTEAEVEAKRLWREPDLVWGLSVG